MSESSRTSGGRGGRASSEHAGNALYPYTLKLNSKLREGSHPSSDRPRTLGRGPYSPSTHSKRERGEGKASPSVLDRPTDFGLVYDNVRTRIGLALPRPPFG